MSTLCVAILVMSASGDAPDRYPSRLRRAIEGQPARTSQVEWTLSWIGGDNDGLEEHFVTRTAGDAVWQSKPGKMAEVRAAEPAPGAPKMSPDNLQRPDAPPRYLGGTENRLIYEGLAWRLPVAERPLSGTVMDWLQPGAMAPVGLPSLPLVPVWHTSFDPRPRKSGDFFGDAEHSASFSEGLANGLPVVRADWNTESVHWTFDDRLGGQPVRAEYFREGRLQFFSETEIQQIAGRWLPKSVRFYTADASEPYKIAEIQQASFDEPWHMQEITPEDIGILNGTQFAAVGDRKVWMGGDLISYDEYLDLQYLFDVEPDARIVEIMAEESNMTVPQYLAYVDGVRQWKRAEHYKETKEEPWLLVFAKPDEKDEWDVYVDKFIAKHKLEGKPVERAQEILKQAKKMRDGHLRKNRANIRKAEQSGDKERIAHYQKYPKQVFDRYLVKSLEKLVPKDKDKGENKSIP
ncbi:MAG: hypothetical protein AABZ12_07390 [Planctomycetota bacterium]